MCGQPHGLLREFWRNSLHLEQDLARTDDRDPMIGSALAFTHTGFGWLLGNRLVRKDAQPDLAAALDETRHCDTACLNLAVGNVPALLYLQAEVTEREIRPAPRLAAHAPALLLAKLDLLWHQHK